MYIAIPSHVQIHLYCFLISRASFFNCLVPIHRPIQFFVKSRTKFYFFSRPDRLHIKSKYVKNGVPKHQRKKTENAHSRWKNQGLLVDTERSNINIVCKCHMTGQKRNKRLFILTTILFFSFLYNKDKFTVYSMAKMVAIRFYF